MNFGLFSSTSLLGFVAMVFLFVRYGLFWNSPWWAKLIVFLICMGLGVLPQIATYRFESGWGELFPYVCNAVSLVYMTAIILVEFQIFIRRDTVGVIMIWQKPLPGRATGNLDYWFRIPRTVLQIIYLILKLPDIRMAGKLFRLYF